MLERVTLIKQITVLQASEELLVYRVSRKCLVTCEYKQHKILNIRQTTESKFKGPKI